MKQKGYNIGDNAKKKKRNYKILIICGAILFVLIGINVLWFSGTITSIVERIDACEWEETVVEPTCVEEGYTLHTCTKHGETYKDKYIEATGHTYGYYETFIEATETTSGYEQETCPVCGEKFDFMREILPIGHNFTQTEIIFIDGDCTKGSVKNYICEDCGFIYSEIWDAPYSNHFFVDGVCINCGMTQEEANAGG